MTWENRAAMSMREQVDDVLAHVDGASFRHNLLFLS